MYTKCYTSVTFLRRIYMKLEEKHKEFVVKCFARFMKLTSIVDVFLEEFEDELPPADMSEVHHRRVLNGGATQRF